MTARVIDMSDERPAPKMLAAERHDGRVVAGRRRLGRLSGSGQPDRDDEPE